MAWILLLAAIGFEVAGTVCMKLLKLASVALVIAGIVGLNLGGAH